MSLVPGVFVVSTFSSVYPSTAMKLSNKHLNY